MKKNKTLTGAILCTVLLLALVFTLLAMNSSGNASALRQSLAESAPSGEPGDVNPVQNPDRCYFFPDDELLCLYITTVCPTEGWWYGNGNDQLTKWNMDQHINNTTTDGTEDGDVIFNNVTNQCLAAASGRVFNETKDDVMSTWFLSNGAGKVSPVVEFYTNGKTERYISPLLFNDTAGNKLDIRVADLDRLMDENDGNFHAEVVVFVYDAGGKTSHLLVLGKNGDTLELLDSESYANTIAVGGVTTGDLNNDGAAEIALLYQENGHTGSWLSTYSLIYAYNNGEEVPRIINDDFELMNGTPGDIASGDFNGDGPDEVFIATFSPGISASNSITLDCISFDEETQILDKSTPVTIATCSTGNTLTSVSLDSGLFRLDPDHNYTTARRQLVLTYQESMPIGTISGSTFTKKMTLNRLVASTYDFSDELIISHKTDYSIRDGFPTKAGSDASKWVMQNNAKPPTASITLWADNSITRPAMVTTGSLLGPSSTAATEPHDYCALTVTYTSLIYGSDYTKPTVNGYIPSFMVLDVTDDANLTLKLPGTANIFNYEQDESGGLALGAGAVPSCVVVANDRTGDGYYLGAPVKVTIEESIDTDFIVEEPPMHLDYLPDEDGNWSVQNMSRKDNFATQIADEKEASIETQKKSSVSHTYGGSLEVNAKDTFKAGPPMDQVKLNASIQAKLEYDYDTVTSNMQGFEGSVTQSVEAATDFDDLLTFTANNIEIWRYPVYGVKSDDGKQVYYEVVVGGARTQNNLGMPGKGADWYQPIHENGNILSYPVIDGTQANPADLGTFTYNGTSKQGLLNPNQQVYTTGNDVKNTISVNFGGSSGESVETKNTLTDNLDIQAGMEFKAGAFCVHNDFSIDGDVAFNNTNSWANSSDSTKSSSMTSSITINQPGMPTEYSYGYLPTMYFSSDGTLKVSQAVDPVHSNSAKNNWLNIYSAGPDPALNLPNKFHEATKQNQSDVTVFNLNEDSDRMMMRGVFLMKQWNADASQRQYLSVMPPAGDSICIMARVYNYSLNCPNVKDNVSGKDNTCSFKVRFYSTPFKLKYDEMPELTLIGEYPVNGLKPQNFAEAHVNWDTTGLEGNEYTIFVVVDPDNEVKNEIHEMYDEDGNLFVGGNNVGYWPMGNPITIAPPENDSGELTSRNLSKRVTTSTSIVKDSIKVYHVPRVGNESITTGIQAGEKYRIRLKLFADHASGKIRYLTVKDNGKPIVSKLIHGLRQGENLRFATFIAKESGLHTFTFELQRDLDDPNKDDNIVKYTVSGDSQVGSGGGGGGCFIATAAFGSYQEPHVQVLRQFRDRILLTNCLGASFVNFYYKNSPPVAAYIAERSWARAITRTLLLPAYAGAYLTVNGWSGLLLLIVLVAATILVVRMRRQKRLALEKI